MSLTFKELSSLLMSVIRTSSVRAVGHTYTALNGINNVESSVFIVADGTRDNILRSVDNPSAKVLSLSELHKLRGLGLPVVFDHYAVCKLSQMVLLFIEDKERELFELRDEIRELKDAKL